MTTAWFNPFSGAAGDMVLGALLDAGADVDAVRAMLGGLDLVGWALEVERTRRADVAATRAVVKVAGSPQPARRLADLHALVGGARLPDRVAARARAAFDALAEAEAAVHGVSPGEVHFHEVGAVDAVVDVVGACVALEVLGVDEVACAPVAVGHGRIGGSAHGELPNPAPAVTRLLHGRPVRGVDTGAELTTPTGAAILVALATAWGPMPAMVVTGSGYGAGSRDRPGAPNVLPVVLGAPAPATRGWPSALAGGGQPVLVLETNLDDVTPEGLAHAVEAALAAGARDAWTTPATMKKGRPGHVLGALVDAERADEVGAAVARETGALGMRVTVAERHPAPRRWEVVEVGGTQVRVKHGPHGWKPEHDDVAALAARLGVGLPEARRAVEAAVLRAPADPGETGGGWAI